MTLQYDRKAISPAIATIALIAVAVAAAAIAGSDMIRKATMSPSAMPVEISEIFMIKISNTKAHLHADYKIQPGWTTTTVSVSFKDDSGATVSFNLPTGSTTFDSAINARVTIGQRYNFIVTPTGSDGNSATVTMPVFVR
ncbi:MAG TPA: archaellin/type IV pilin N-terminal domain-containing protein [Nitrososphaera sp.]|nr:archaellin/type IV pilin N-terminal domain-containing protein [Nitrososphaera sp.]